MKMIFILQYINTAVVLIPLNQDIYPDLYTNWYTDVGSTYILVVVILAVMPLVSFILSYLRLFLLRWWDKGLCFCCSSKNKTEQTTIQRYLDLHAGPEMQINYRYAIILNLIFVTFSHGIAFPILFPICFAGLVIQYILEHYLLAHFYKQPPMLDNYMNTILLDYLRYAPCFMFVFGFWYLENG